MVTVTNEHVKPVGAGSAACGPADAGPPRTAVANSVIATHSILRIRLLLLVRVPARHRREQLSALCRIARGSGVMEEHGRCQSRNPALRDDSVAYTARATRKRT